MPSSATITAFYSFTANTKARAAQVNSNFSVYRGHMVAVDPNTATAVNNTYDLGSNEYYWRAAYAGSIEFRGVTTTVASTIQNDVNTSTGAHVFKIGGVENFRLTPSGTATLTVNRFSMKSRSTTTGGSNPGYGGYAYGTSSFSTGFYVLSSGADVLLVNSTITLSCVGGLLDYSFVSATTTSNGTVNVNQTGGANEIYFTLYDNTTTSTLATVYFTPRSLAADIAYPPSIVNFKVPVSAGVHNFFVGVKSGSNGTKLNFPNIASLAYEV